MPRLTCLPVFTPSTVIVTSSPMRTDSPIRRVKIKIGRPSLLALPSGRVCQTRPAGTPNPAYGGRVMLTPFDRELNLGQ